MLYVVTSHRRRQVAFVDYVKKGVNSMTLYNEFVFVLNYLPLPFAQLELLVNGSFADGLMKDVNELRVVPTGLVAFGDAAAVAIDLDDTVVDDNAAVVTLTLTVGVVVLDDVYAAAEERFYAEIAVLSTADIVVVVAAPAVAMRQKGVREEFASFFVAHGVPMTEVHLVLAVEQSACVPVVVVAVFDVVGFAAVPVLTGEH